MTVCFITMFAWGGKCVAGTLCGSVACLAKMVRHALVTSGELIISQERDVLATALGSLEDKRRMSPVEAVVTGWILWKGEAGNGPVPFAPGASLRSAWFRHQGRGCVRVWACVRVCARRNSLRGASPTGEPGDFRTQCGGSGENNHVMSGRLTGNRMLWNSAWLFFLRVLYFEVEDVHVNCTHTNKLQTSFTLHTKSKQNTFKCLQNTGISLMGTTAVFPFKWLHEGKQHRNIYVYVYSFNIETTQV